MNLMTDFWREDGRIGGIPAYSRLLDWVTGYEKYHLLRTERVSKNLRMKLWHLKSLCSRKVSLLKTHGSGVLCILFPALWKVQTGQAGNFIKAICHLLSDAIWSPCAFYFLCILVEYECGRQGGRGQTWVVFHWYRISHQPGTGQVGWTGWPVTPEILLSWSPQSLNH